MARTILVAEDDRTARLMLARVLRKEGYDVIEASNGREALELARSELPDVCLIDWFMPELDGIEVCRAVRDDPALNQMFLIVVTSHEDRDSVVQALDNGADEFIQKPWNARELLARIRAGLRMVELQKSLTLRNEQFQHVMTRLNHELTLVANIQKVLLPQDLPESPNLGFTAFYLPSTECGGDYYDLVRLEDGRLGFVIADVSGHGAPAMVAMALIRQNFHIICNRFDEPHRLLEELNRLLFDHLPTDQYATMLYAILDPEDDARRCIYASAGHNPPIWFHAETGDTTTLEGCEGYPLKLVTRDATYESHTIEPVHDDRLVCYTDGFPECFSPHREIYGMPRFVESVGRHAGEDRLEQAETGIVTDVMAFANNHPTEDDLTLALLHFK